MLEVRVKRCADLTTDASQRVCNLHLPKLPGHTETCRTRISYLFRWEAWWTKI